MKFWISSVIVFSFIIATTLNSCTKINYATDSTSLLEFSHDTLMFDSVFTTIGSISHYLRVVNIHDEALLINEISLEKAQNSEYRINVDGVGLDENNIPLTTIQNITLLPGDSLYVFVEVTVDPTNTTSAFICEDRLRFNTNTVDQFVDLIAYGRNAFFHHQPGNWLDSNNPPAQVLSCNEVWSSDLPHVVYGPLRVEPGCSLTIEAGAEVYVHKGSGIWIHEGTLNIEGDLNNKVVFQGDRLDGSFVNAAGQWGLEFPIEFDYEGENVYFTVSRGGIWLDRSVNSRINHAVFKNGTIGLWVDSLGSGADHSLKITNTEISNMSAIGLLSQGGYIDGVNNLFTDCGEACGAFTLGGKIVMHLSTFANYWSSGSVRQGTTVYINDWYESAIGNQHRPFEYGTEFRNCIIWGNNAELDDHDELTSNLYDASIYSDLFVACGVDVQDEEFPLFILSENTTTDIAPPFVTTSFITDFRLESNSSIWNGVSSIPPYTPADVSLDINGMPRSTFSPDKGCYERY